jgi:hypothetical protein
MAAQHAAHSETETTADTVRTNGLLRIVGAGGRITAASLHAEHDLQGRKNNAINADQKDGNRLHEPFSMAKFPKKATRYRRNPCVTPLAGFDAFDMTGKTTPMIEELI